MDSNLVQISFQDPEDSSVYWFLHPSMGQVHHERFPGNKRMHWTATCDVVVVFLDSTEELFFKWVERKNIPLEKKHWSSGELFPWFDFSCQSITMTMEEKTDTRHKNLHILIHQACRRTKETKISRDRRLTKGHHKAVVARSNSTAVHFPQRSFATTRRGTGGSPHWINSIWFKKHRCDHSMAHSPDSEYNSCWTKRFQQRSGNGNLPRLKLHIGFNSLGSSKWWCPMQITSSSSTSLA